MGLRPGVAFQQPGHLTALNEELGPRRNELLPASSLLSGEGWRRPFEEVSSYREVVTTRKPQIFLKALFYSIWLNVKVIHQPTCYLFHSQGAPCWLSLWFWLSSPLPLILHSASLIVLKLQASYGPSVPTPWLAITTGTWSHRNSTSPILKTSQVVWLCINYPPPPKTHKPSCYTLGS